MKKNVCKCFLILLLFVFSNQLLASQYTLNSTIGSFGAVSETGNSHLIVSGGQTTNQQSANQGYTLLAGNIFRTNLSIEVPTIVYPPNHKIMYRYNISFDWTDINNAASYDFELFGTSLCNTTSSQYTIELTTGTYQWRVRAMLNDVIKSSWTETMEVIVTTSNYNPIIFVHGRQLVNSRGFNALDYWRGKPDSEFEDTTAMTKIITGKYQDYIAGKLECNYQTTQDDLYTSIASTDNKNKTIWNFTYYGNDCGVIGSNGNLSATGVEGVAYYADHSSGVQVPFGLPAGLVYSTALTSGGSQAERLANFIDKVLDVTGTEKVNIVAHSLGGLVSRSAIKWYGCNTKVKKLITIGTPNQGADYSVFEYLMGGYGDFPYGEDLETFRFNKFSNGSREDTFTNFLNEGNPGDWAGGVKYATIAGTRSPLPWGRNINKIEINYTIRDDCLFNTEWVELPGAEFNAITYASHGTSINGNMDTYIPLTSIKAEMTVGPIIGENSLTSCNYTTDIIRCWIMDDINPFIYKETGESQRSYLFSTSPEIVKIRTQFEPMGPALWGIPCEVRADINFKNSFNKNKYIWLTVTCNSWDTNNGTEEVTRVYDSTGNIVGCTVKANTYWIYTSSISSEGYWYPVEPSKMKFSYTIAGEVVDSSVDKFQYVYGPIEYKDLNFETYGTESVPITAILNVGDSNYEIYKIDRIPLSDYNGNYSSTTVIFSTYVCINISLDPKPIGPSSGKIQLQQSAAEYKYRIFLYTRKSNPSQDIEISSPTVDSIKPRSRVNTPSNYFVNAATFTVMWTGIDDYSGIKCYHIEYSTDNFNTWQLWSIESTSWTYLTTSTFNVTGLTSDTTIYFRSRAEDYAGNLEDWGAQTDYDCYAVIDLTPPSTVQLLSPPNNGYDNHNNGYAVFDWQDSTDDRLAYYELQVDTMPDMSNASIVSIEESEFNLFIYDYYGQNYGLDDGRYYWRVRAKDAAGNTSPWSTTWSFIIDP
ncbi:MAG: alpha/beta fold hydrolase, partial [Elusimicrobiota bacterium]